MGDFDYLGDVKLGSSIVVKPKKQRSLSVKMGIVLTTIGFLSGAIGAGAIGFTQFQKNSNPTMAIPSPSMSEIPEPQSSPSASIDLNRGSYEVAGTETVPKKAVKTKKATKSVSTPKSTPVATPSPSAETSETIASGSGSDPRPICTKRDRWGHCISTSGGQGGGSSGGSGGGPGGGHNPPTPSPRH